MPVSFTRLIPRNAPELASAARWTGRVIGGAILVLFTAIFVGWMPLDPAEMVGDTLISALQAAAIVLIPIGLLLAIFFETAGGLLALAALAAFYGLEFLADGSLPTGWMFPLTAAPALAFILAGLISPRERRLAAT